jgi:hypothetical protein
MTETPVEQTCQECRASTEWIWIGNPKTKGHSEERLCEGCHEKLSFDSSVCMVHGSQWSGED